MLDFYREVIESPEYIPDAIKKSIDFHRADDKGRIYRIVPNHPKRRSDLKVNLGSASIAELVKELENPNGWNCETAHRLLLERQDRSATLLLADLARRSARPQTRLQALWTLEGIGGLESELVISALHDPEPHIREHALRLAEEFLPEQKAIADAVLGLQRDTDARALSTHPNPGPRRGTARARYTCSPRFHGWRLGSLVPNRNSEFSRRSPVPAL